MTDMFEEGKQFAVAADRPRPSDGLNDVPSYVVTPLASSTEVPPSRVEPTLYRLLAEPTWFQRGEECTGFALAAAVNFLGRRSRLAELNGAGVLPTHTHLDWEPPSVETLQPVLADRPSVSPRMMYEMAQVYDLEDDSFEGSTLLGALSGWWRCGVTTDELWPYADHDDHGERHGTWTVARISDARTRQLESSDEQRRISPTDLTAMKAALANNDVLYVDAEVHDGWFRPLLPGVSEIPAQPGDKGFHAFLIIGYNEEGFWVHNSWGRFWGDDGYALLPYEDWMFNGRGVWVPAFAGGKTSRQDRAQQLERNEDEVAKEMWGHIVALDDEGRLSRVAPYEATSDTVRSLFYMFEQQAKALNWERPRLLLYADDGSRPRAETIERLAKLREPLMQHEIFPIFLVWDVPWLPDLDHELQLRDRQGHEDFLVGTDDLDTNNLFAYWLYELKVARSLAVQMWRALQVRATKAAALDTGGARILAQRIAEKRESMEFDLHVATHGAGDFLLSELLFHLPAITSAELLAPATTIAQYESSYGQLLRRDRLGRVAVTVSDDERNADDRIGSFPGSVLHLASRVLAVDGVDDARRFVGAPTQDPDSEDPDATLEADFAAWSKFTRTTDGSVELLPVQPILGLPACVGAAVDASNRPGQVAVYTVDASHFDVPSSDAVLSAVIGRIEQSSREVPVVDEPEPTTVPEPVPVSDVGAPPLMPGVRVLDPLQIALDQLRQSPGR